MVVVLVPGVNFIYPQQKNTVKSFKYLYRELKYGPCLRHYLVGESSH